MKTLGAIIVPMLAPLAARGSSKRPNTQPVTTTTKPFVCPDGTPPRTVIGPGNKMQYQRDKVTVGSTLTQKP